MDRMSIGIIGMGLMGSSLARALNKYTADIEIWGADIKQEHVEYNLSRGIISGELQEENMKNQDIIFLAVPVRAITAVIEDIYPYINLENTIITDMGSTKEWIYCWVNENYPRLKYVGGHPLTGREKSGPEAGQAELYSEKNYILIVGDKTDKAYTRKIRAILDRIGAEVLLLEAEKHDQILALTSHLPQLMSTALMSTAGKFLESDELATFSGGGFRDMTRIAGSNPRMWQDILLTNQEYIAEQLEKIIVELERYRGLVVEGKKDDIYRFMEEGKRHYLQFKGVDHETES